MVFGDSDPFPGPYIRQRGDSFELKLDIGKDPDGKRITEYRTVRGGRRQAETELAKLVAAISRGEHVAKSSLTVGQHVAERIEVWAATNKVTARTKERYADLHRNQIMPFLGQIPLQALKSIDVEKWHGLLLAKGRKDGMGGLAPQTIKHAHRLLTQTLREAARHDLVVKNVASLISPPRVKGAEIEILTADQIRVVLTELKDHSIYLKAILAIFAGMRRGEVLALRWQDIDFDRKVIAVKAALEETKAGGICFKTPKSKAGVREIPLPEILVEALRDYRREQLELRLALGAGKLTDDVLLFARLGGGPQSPNQLSADWSTVATRIGLDVTYHALRHTYASWLIDGGVDVVKVAKLLGHASSAQTLDVYSHLFDRRADKSADVINAAAAAILTPR